MNYKIIDNLLSPEELKEVQEIMINGSSMDRRLPWYFKGKNINADSAESPVKEYPTPDYIYSEMTHVMRYYDDSLMPDSPWCKIGLQIINKIEPTSVYRIKCNMGFINDEPLVSGWHYDSDDDNGPWKNCYSAIYYVNTNNGKTILEDGTIINSIENRLAIFPNDTLHTGVSQTDEDVRVLINFGFYLNKDLKEI